MDTLADIADTHAPPRISLLGTTALLFEAPGEMSLPTQQRIWALAGEAAASRAAWSVARPLALEGRVVELPVVYGGEGGPHLADVVAHTGLDVDEIVERHCAPLYPVFALGSHPGYCYLGGMDARIATPRRQVPVISIPGGSVSIGGHQTGVSASAGPSGWNTIGLTSMSFFDATRQPPALLQPGDSIRFRVQQVIR
jgi:5-oxoprolinase (ATP-hydrolysing) subunit B